MQYTPYYNGYQPTYYQPPVQDQLTQLRQNQYQQAPSTSPIIWVQGEAAARAYMVAAGNSVLLMDSDASVFYLKTTDVSGMPQPMRIFDYTERKQNQPPVASTAEPVYVTRDEFDALAARIDALTKTEREENDNG